MKTNPQTQEIQKAQDELKKSVHRIWLAGLGALATAEEEGSRLFSRLMERGRDIESRPKVDQVTAGAEKVKAKAETSYENWDEEFDKRLNATLRRLGQPSPDEIRSLEARIASLTAKVALLHAHGLEVEPESMDPMVQEAVTRLQRTLYRPDSRADLTEAEAHALEKGGFVLEPESSAAEDPLALTVAEYAALLKSSLSTSEAAKRLEVDPSRIRQRLTSDPPTLFGIRVGSSWYIPEFQFDGCELIRGVGEVIAQLDPELHPVAVFRWFTTPNPDLSTGDPRGGSLSPREWLRLGFPVQPAVELASNL